MKKSENNMGDTEATNLSWAERHGISNGWLALLWVIAAFVLFQVFGGVIAVVLVVLKASNGSGTIDMQHISTLIGQNMGLVFLSNSIGQILFLALATWFFCRLQANADDRPAFLRLQFFDNTFAMMGLVFLLMLAVQPVIWLLGWLNSLIPFPQVLQSLQMQQMQKIKDYLGGHGHLWIVMVNVAIVPAFCEEILFRGYALRSFQKSWGIITAIILSGVIFGIFHMEPSNFLPLASIGILLAFLTWVTRSIYPAMVAHFVNNGTSVLVGRFYPQTTFASTTASTPPSPYLVLLSILISGFLLYLLFNNVMNPRRDISS